MPIRFLSTVARRSRGGRVALSFVACAAWTASVAATMTGMMAVQAGPSWEVPRGAMGVLSIARVLAALLIAVGAVPALAVWRSTRAPRKAATLLLLLGAAAVLLLASVCFFEPAEWPVQAASLSHAIRVWGLLVDVVALVVGVVSCVALCRAAVVTD